jgi:radical SAM superfamily enzyme YgiQ (UPF0313 family)
VGFSLNFLNQALTTFAMIGHVKRHYPETRIIVGGGLVTSWMRNPLWSNPFAHLAEWVAGDGEGPLLSRFGIEQTQAWYCPDYRDFLDNDYLSPGRVLPFCTSGGCYWRKCRFCPETAEKNPYHAMAVPTVMDQLDDLVESVGPGLIHLVDNALSPALLKAMDDRKVKTPWYGFARMTPQLAAPDLCRSLKQSGCVMLKLGLESGDANVLRQMNKGVDLALASRILDQLHRAGIATYVYLLFGTPAEDEAAAEKTMAFVVDHSEKIGFLNIAVFNLPYFADEAEVLQTRLFYDGDLSLYREFTHPLGWERPLIRRFLDKQFKKHPRIAAIVHRDPPVFGSNHAPFFCMS